MVILRTPKPKAADTLSYAFDSHTHSKPPNLVLMRCMCAPSKLLNSHFHAFQVSLPLPKNQIFRPIKFYRYLNVCSASSTPRTRDSDSSSKSFHDFSRYETSIKGVAIMISFVPVKPNTAKIWNLWCPSCGSW
jgi:hypothetical protein